MYININKRLLSALASLFPAYQEVCLMIQNLLISGILTY